MTRIHNISIDDKWEEGFHYIKLTCKIKRSLAAWHNNHNFSVGRPLIWIRTTIQSVLYTLHNSVIHITHKQSYATDCAVVRIADYCYYYASYDIYTNSCSSVVSASAPAAYKQLLRPPTTTTTTNVQSWSPLLLCFSAFVCMPCATSSRSI